MKLVHRQLDITLSNIAVGSLCARHEVALLPRASRRRQWGVKVWAPRLARFRKRVGGCARVCPRGGGEGRSTRSAVAPSASRACTSSARRRLSMPPPAAAARGSECGVVFTLNHRLQAPSIAFASDCHLPCEKKRIPKTCARGATHLSSWGRTVGTRTGHRPPRS